CLGQCDYAGRREARAGYAQRVRLARVVGTVYPGGDRLDLLSLARTAEGGKDGIASPSPPETEQVRKNLVGAPGTSGQLAPQSEAHIHPVALAVGCLDQGSKLFAAVVRKPILELYQIAVFWIAVPEKIETALLHPVLPRRVGDPVRKVEHRIGRRQNCHRGELVSDAVGADLCGIRAVLRLVELKFVVLDDQRPAIPHVIEQATVVRS